MLVDFGTATRCKKLDLSGLSVKGVTDYLSGEYYHLRLLPFILKVCMRSVHKQFKFIN